VDEPTQAKADLIPNAGDYDDVVRSWIESEETLAFVCRQKKYPPEENIVKTWQRQGVVSYLLFSEGKPVAYGELWNRPMEMAVEIAHVLLDPYKRSRGFGTKIVTLLYNRAAARTDIAKVIVNIYGENEIALGCFIKAGFELVSRTPIDSGLRMVRMV